MKNDPLASNPLTANPKAPLPINPLFERPTPEHRVQALIEVMDVLTKQKPLNLDSPIVIIAPTPTHASWRWAARTTIIGRYIEVKNAVDFIEMVPNMEIQWVILIDDIYPDQRPFMARAFRGLRPELGHRVFPVTTQYIDPEKAAASGFTILGLASPPLTNPYSIPGPNEDTNQ
jgi:hypothetical protein